jgi:hypothetical protein
MIPDEHAVEPGPGVAPGSYGLRVALYVPTTGQRLPVASGGDYADLGTVTVR